MTARWIETLYMCDTNGDPDLEVRYATEGMCDGTVELEIVSPMPSVFLDREQAFNLATQLMKFVAKMD